MVKPLAFKGDKRSKKRKHTEIGKDDIDGNSSKALVTTNTASGIVDEDDSWVTAEAPNDVTGPIIFALPTTRPSCIACDANGKVFTSEIENVVDGDLATAEPHDVRQVWVANRVAGTEYVSFNGHHGRYILLRKYFSLPTDCLDLLTGTYVAINLVSCRPLGKLSQQRNHSCASPHPIHQALSISRPSAMVS